MRTIERILERARLAEEASANVTGAQTSTDSDAGDARLGKKLKIVTRQDAREGKVKEGESK